MPLNRNVLFLIIGALIVATAVLSYQLYQDRKKPEGVQINLGPAGISIDKK
jgi:RsiW-degrading membrane proteinase PrsW (M82 family)